jgi:hypothetical protein
MKMTFCWSIYFSCRARKFFSSVVVSTRKTQERGQEEFSQPNEMVILHVQWQPWLLLWKKWGEADLQSEWASRKNWCYENSKTRYQNTRAFLQWNPPPNFFLFYKAIKEDTTLAETKGVKEGYSYYNRCALWSVPHKERAYISSSSSEEKWWSRLFYMNHHTFHARLRCLLLLIGKQSSCSILIYISLHFKKTPLFYAFQSWCHDVDISTPL